MSCTERAVPTLVPTDPVPCKTEEFDPDPTLLRDNNELTANANDKHCLTGYLPGNISSATTSAVYLAIYLFNPTDSLSLCHYLPHELI